MALVVLINIASAAIAAAMPNDFLMLNSYLFYGFQALTMFPFLLRRTVYIKNLFLPTFFVLAYVLFNLTLGSYLVPREFGWNKSFAVTVTDIQHYRLIVPFFMLSNIVLFALTASGLRTLASTIDCSHSPIRPLSASLPLVIAKTGFFLSAFFLIAYSQVYSGFSFLLALLLLHLTDSSIRGKWYRYAVYAFYLIVSVAFNYENKREIAIILLLIVFLEAYFGRYRLKLTLKSVVGYGVATGAFGLLILAASILRGYGQFFVGSVIEAMSLVPAYIGSEFFIDGLTDNLELNYVYGVTVTSVDHVLRGLIDYQYGATLVKVMFLPIPRSMLPLKPESAMQIFTQEYAPDWWIREGSLPVIFVSDMFMNFHYLGLLAYAIVWMLVNQLFLRLHSAAANTFVWYSILFLVITVLIFARGGGIEQWLLYYLLAAPLLLLFRIVASRFRSTGVESSRWVV
jgi:hypothetical protein